MISHPNELQWIEGELPDVHSVSKDCRVLIWKVYDNAEKPITLPNKSCKFVTVPELNGLLKEITVARPWENKLNPLRWCDPYPIGFQEKVKFYAWLKS